MFQVGIYYYLAIITPTVTMPLGNARDRDNFQILHEKYNCTTTENTETKMIMENHAEEIFVRFLALPKLSTNNVKAH